MQILCHFLAVQFDFDGAKKYCEDEILWREQSETDWCSRGFVMARVLMNDDFDVAMDLATQYYRGGENPEEGEVVEGPSSA